MCCLHRKRRKALGPVRNKHEQGTRPAQKWIRMTFLLFYHTFKDFALPDLYFLLYRQLPVTLGVNTEMIRTCKESHTVMICLIERGLEAVPQGVVMCRKYLTNQEGTCIINKEIKKNPGSHLCVCVVISQKHRGQSFTFLLFNGGRFLLRCELKGVRTFLFFAERRKNRYFGGAFYQQQRIADQ